MKCLALLILFLFSQVAYSLELYRFIDDKNPKMIVTIYDLDGMSVNEKCFKEKAKCLTFFIEKTKHKKMFVKDKIQIGHPASENCSTLSGASEIFTDKENNQHDYCVFKEGYFIDSWNLLKRFK
jgi:putative hemolysin